MVLNRLILFSPLLTFLLLVLGGALFAELGAVIVRRRMQRLGEDSEMSDLVVAPVLGLFALVVAFTFGQAISVQSAKDDAVAALQHAAHRVTLAAAALPDDGAASVRADVAQWLQTTDRLSRTEALQDRAEVDRTFLDLQAIAVRAEAAGAQAAGEQLLATANALSEAHDALASAAAGSVPANVIALQSVYYLVSFFLTGYVVASKQSYGASRIGVVGLALLFSLVMYMVLNLGHPGLGGVVIAPGA